MPARWIDVSAPLRDGMVRWPDNPAVSVRRTQSLDRGDHFNISALSMGAHSGTHVDGPLHILRDGPGVDRMPPEATVGPARVIEIDDPVAIRPPELVSARIRRGERVLFKTRNSRRGWPFAEFFSDYVFIGLDAARWLVERGVRTVGVDYLSVGAFSPESEETHRTLLGGGVWVIEGLDLSAVRAGRFELICLPLRIEGSDGAPARAFLRRRAAGGRRGAKS